MNGYQRIKCALKGQRPDRVPIMLHNFLLAIKEAGVTHAQYRSDPEVIARTMIQAVETYGYDGVVVDIDTVTLAGAVGVPVDYPENQPARSHAGCLNTIKDAAALEPVDISTSKYVQVWLESVRLLKKYFDGEIYIRGNCDQAPFSLACSMRTPQALMMDLMDDDSENDVLTLLAYCTDLSCQFIKLMAGAGADMASNGDSPAGPDMISPAMYQKYAFPFEKQVKECARDTGVAYALHICGNTNPILSRMAGLEADAIELDYKTDIQLIHDTFSKHTCFIGNIDPTAILTFGTPELVQQTTRNLLEHYQDSPRFILNAGCAIPAETPPKNLRAMIRTAREFNS